MRALVAVAVAALMLVACGTSQEVSAQGQIACGECHGLPPPAPHPQIARCDGCHAGATHMDGKVEEGAHPAGWITSHQGPSCHECHVSRTLGTCAECHSDMPSTACATCH
jgi:hypothetical protein